MKNFEGLKKEILDGIKALEEEIKLEDASDYRLGVYFKNMVTGESFGYRADEQFPPASVIKFPMLCCIEKWVDEGKADFDEMITVTEEEKVPICGAITLIPGDVTISVRALCNLMISISDNTATNVLMHHYGIPAYQEAFKELGLEGTEIQRAMFEVNPNARNRIVPAEMGMLLEKMHRRTLISEKASEDIEETLLTQQIEHKIPGFLNWEYSVAHKTGEDDYLSNDVGLVFTEEPFVVCWCGNNIDCGPWETFIRTASKKLVEACD